MDKKNSHVILNFIYCLVNNYLPNGLFIIANNSKKLISLPDYTKLIICTIGQLETDFVMSKNTAIYSVANTINKSQIQSDLYFI